jgi:hypothetical protein
MAILFLNNKGILSFLINNKFHIIILEKFATTHDA